MDGSGHSSEAMHYPKWQGESIGFWDGSALVIYTNQIKGWNASHSLIEWTDNLTAVERYESIDGQHDRRCTFMNPLNNGNLGGNYVSIIDSDGKEYD